MRNVHDATESRYGYPATPAVPNREKGHWNIVGPLKKLVDQHVRHSGVIVERGDADDYCSRDQYSHSMSVHDDGPILAPHDHHQSPSCSLPG